MKMKKILEEQEGPDDAVREELKRMKREGWHRHKIYKVVKQLINATDPIGLLALGCPDDEYESEINDIAEQVGDCCTVTEIEDLLHQTFVKWFDEAIAGDRKVYLGMAKQLHQALKVLRRILK